MNLSTLFKTEIKKQQRGFIWLMILGIPLGTTVAMFLDMYLRYHSYLINIAKRRGLTSWQILLTENHSVLGWGFFLPIFIAVIATIVHNTEFEEDNWKKLLTLPVSRTGVYISKLLTILFFSFIMIALNTLGLIIVGKVIGFPESIDYKLYISYIGYQYIAILGVAAIHNLLSIHLKDAIQPVIIGFIGIIVTPSILSKSAIVGHLLPYSYTYSVDILKEGASEVVLYGGIISMILISIIGVIVFNKKDII